MFSEAQFRKYAWEQIVKIYTTVLDLYGYLPLSISCNKAYLIRLVRKSMTSGHSGDYNNM